MVADEEEPVRVHQIGRATDVLPLCDECSVWCENLNPPVLPVGDVDATLIIGINGVWKSKLVRTFSARASLEKKITLGIEFCDALVTIAI